MFDSVSAKVKKKHQVKKNSGLMIKLTRSQQFLNDLEEALEWLYFKAAEE